MTEKSTTRQIRPGRPRKGEEAERRDQLLDHAQRLFAEHGYGCVSLETVAKEARVSLRTIYRHFGGKADLFGGAVRRCSDLFVATLTLDPAEKRPFEAILVEFAHAYLFRLTRPEAIRMRAQIMAEAHRFPELAAEFYAQGPARTRERLMQFFALQQRRGNLGPGETGFMAEQFLGSLRGDRFQRLQLGLEEPPSEGDVRVWAQAAVKLFVSGGRGGL